MDVRSLTRADEASAVRAHEQLVGEGFELLLGWSPGTDWPAYLDRLERERAGIDLADGRVPATFLVAVVDDEVVGRVSVRHELNDFLARVGGHIGYAVVPSARGRGYATAMLRHGLGVLAPLGVTRALVTCDDDNRASAAVIERCGGHLEDVVDGKRRYWVPTRT